MNTRLTRLRRSPQLGQTTNPTTPDSLLDILRLLATVLEELESDRQKWWTSPEKREQRRRLEEEVDQRKLSALHKINNETNERIEAMSAKLGLFVQWSLGMNEWRDLGVTGGV
jgi:hypothetical protein